MSCGIRFPAQSLPKSFEIAYKNDGSVHVVPYGTISIRNIFGTEIAQVPVDAYFALPDSVRYQEINWAGKKFAFGYYTAELELYRGFNQEFDTQKIRFAVLPLIVIIPSILLLIVMLILYRVTLRKFEIKRKD